MFRKAVVEANWATVDGAVSGKQIKGRHPQRRVIRAHAGAKPSQAA